MNEDRIRWFNDPEGKIQAEQSRDKRLLLATIHHLDHAIGNVIEAIKETGQMDNTMVLFSSDNGPWVNNAGGGYPDNYPLKNYNQPDKLRGKKLDVWEGGIHVPGFIYWPAKITPREVTQETHVIDWFPTLASIMKVTDKEKYQWDGADLSPILFDGQQIPERDFYWIWSSPINRWAIRHNNWKAVKYGKGDPVEEDWQLYNLTEDPEEANNVSDEHPQLVSELHQRFLTHRRKDKYQ